MLTLVVVLGLVVLVARALARPVPTETKRIKTYSRVPWVPKEIDVPVRRKPTDKK